MPQEKSSYAFVAGEEGKRYLQTAVLRKALWLVREEEANIRRSNAEKERTEK